MYGLFGFSWFVWQMLVNINLFIYSFTHKYGSWGNGLEFLELFASSFGNVLTLLVLPPCYHWGHECILMCHVSSFLAIWLVGVLFVCSCYVGSEDWWGYMQVILTCHSTMMGGTTHIAQEVGKSWYSPLLLYWVVVSNIIGEAKSFICLPETNMFPQVHTWSKTRMTCTHVVVYSFQPACMVIYSDLLFLGWYWWLPTSCFTRTFQTTCFFSYELMLHVCLL